MEVSIQMLILIGELFSCRCLDISCTTGTVTLTSTLHCRVGLGLHYCHPPNVVTGDTYLIYSQMQHVDFDNDSVNLVDS